MKKVTSLFLFLVLVFFIDAKAQLKDSLSYYVKLYNTSSNADEYIKTLSFFEADEKISARNDNLTRQLYDLYFIAKIQNRLENVYDSEVTTLKGLKIIDQLPLNDDLIDRKKSFYNHLGILKRGLQDYKSSINYYLKTLEYSKSKWDSALAFNNMGVNYMYQENYVKAKEYFLKSTSDFKSLKDSSYLAMALNNLGYVQFKLHEEGSIHTLNSALKMREDIGNSKTFDNYMNLVEYYVEHNKLDSALFYAKKGYKLSKKQNLPYSKLIALEKMIRLNQPGFSEKYFSLNDSIQLVALKANEKYGSYKYDIEKEQKKSEQALAKEKQRTTIAWIIFAFVTIGGISLLFHLRRINKLKEAHARYETEQMISKRLHDEVANDVFHLMTRVEKESGITDVLADDLDVIYHKTRNLSKSYASIDVGEHFGQELQDLLISYQGNGVRVILKNYSSIDWSKLNKEKKEVLHRVLQELMTNMKKHSRASFAVINFLQEKKLQIIYSDNGVGSDIKKGSGLQNTENRIQMVGGAITFESEPNKGFKVKINM